MRSGLAAEGAAGSGFDSRAEGGLGDPDAAVGEQAHRAQRREGAEIGDRQCEERLERRGRRQPGGVRGVRQRRAAAETDQAGAYGPGLSISTAAGAYPPPTCGKTPGGIKNGAER